MAGQREEQREWRRDQFAEQQSAGSAEPSGEGCGAGCADNASHAHPGDEQAYAAGTDADFTDEEYDQDA